MFRTENDGSVIWLPSSEEDVQKFKDSLRERGPISIENIQAQLNKFSEMFLKQNDGTVKSNLFYKKSLINYLKNPGIVDIIIPVFNGLHVLKPALKALKDRTDFPHIITIVDDASTDLKVKQFLADWQADNPEHKLITQSKNKGFAATINKGIRSTHGKYVCILNSDVMVTPNWLSKLVLALEEDPRNVIVNPVTNNTAIIEIPMHPGLSYLDMNQGLEAISSHDNPEIMPTGFCFMFKRELYNKIGAFDEAYISYGEESDFWMRTISYADTDGTFPRLRAVLADNVYVYHERGSSFSGLPAAKHAVLRKGGSERFHTIWPQFRDWRRHNKIEDSISYLKEPLPERVLKKSSPYNIAFLVFSTKYCGGMAFITDIVNELIERGINAKIVQVKRSPEHPDSIPMGELRTGPIVFQSPEECQQKFKEKVFSKGVIVAATNEMQPLVSALSAVNKDLVDLLFSQSYDPALAPSDEIRKHMEQQYSIAENIISNAKWLDNTIKKLSKRSTFGYVSPGVNHDLFYPRDRTRGDDLPTVAFFLNPNDPYRGFDRGLDAAYNLYHLCLASNTDVRLVGIGVESIKGAPFITCLGPMPQARLANYLATEVDIVCDPQHIHSYGMPSLEAMASGAVPVCWDNIGIHEFAINGKNAVILPREATSEMIAKEMFDLIKNPNLLADLKKEAIKAAALHDRKQAVSEFISIIEKNLSLTSPKRKIYMVTPHLRKHGGPTTILRTAQILKRLGHDVTLGIIYPDISPEIMKDVDLPISIKWQDPGHYDVVITNSDNPYNEQFSYAKWADKKILFKLSHNPRFKKIEDDALKLEWDAIVTTTNWLVEACAKPWSDKGWTHPPRDASRVGWYHYGHKNFDCPPSKRKYFTNGIMTVATLIHHHPLKGTPEALKALYVLKQRYGDKISIFGIGEWPDFKKHCPSWMQYYLGLDRIQMAQFLQQVDVFLSTSESEGLGRMALEAMSAGCLVIKTPTNAEFEKDDENCIVTAGFKAEDFVAAFDRLGEGDKKFKKLVQNGYKTAKSLSDPTTYKENWKRVLEKIYES